MITTVFILHAKRTDIDHNFIEVFSSEAKKAQWLSTAKNVIVFETTLHEVDPVGPIAPESAKFIRPV